VLVVVYRVDLRGRVGAPGRELDTGRRKGEGGWEGGRGGVKGGAAPYLC